MPTTDFVRNILPTRGRGGRSWAEVGSARAAREGPKSLTKLPLAVGKGCAMTDRSGKKLRTRQFEPLRGSARNRHSDFRLRLIDGKD